MMADRDNQDRPTPMDRWPKQQTPAKSDAYYRKQRMDDLDAKMDEHPWGTALYLLAAVGFVGILAAMFAVNVWKGLFG